MPSSSFLPSSELCQCRLPNGQSAKEPIKGLAGPSFPNAESIAEATGTLLVQEPFAWFILPCP